MKKQLNKFGLTRYFSKIITSEFLQSYKCSENFGIKLMEFINNPKDGVIFIGDNKVDIFTAKTAGVKSVLISKNNFNYDQDFTIKEIIELKDIISNLV